MKYNEVSGKAECNSVKQQSGRGDDLPSHEEIDISATKSKEQEQIKGSTKGLAPNDSSSPLTGMHILLVEDNRIELEKSYKSLNDSGALVDTAMNGQKAVENFASSSADYYNLILMDIHMPILNGYKAVQAIRALSRSDAQTTIIIAMIADSYNDDAQKCLNSGMNGYITKPISMDTVFRAYLQILTDLTVHHSHRLPNHK